jgi:hypothetical protein
MASTRSMACILMAGMLDIATHQAALCQAGEIVHMIADALGLVSFQLVEGGGQGSFGLAVQTKVKIAGDSGQRFIWCPYRDP